MKIKYNTEIISGLVFIIVAAVLWLLIPSQIQTLEKSAINAQTIPRIAIGGLFLCSAGLLIQGLLSHDKKKSSSRAKVFTLKASVGKCARLSLPSC